MKAQNRTVDNIVQFKREQASQLRSARQETEDIEEKREALPEKNTDISLPKLTSGSLVTRNFMENQTNEGIKRIKGKEAYQNHAIMAYFHSN